MQNTNKMKLKLKPILTFAQGESEIPIQNISTDSNVVYRLFATDNFIKLNTRNGQMWQVQWSLKDNQFEKGDRLVKEFELWCNANIS